VLTREPEDTLRECWKDLAEKAENTSCMLRRPARGGAAVKVSRCSRSQGPRYGWPWKWVVDESGDLSRHDRAIFLPYPAIAHQMHAQEESPRMALPLGASRSEDTCRDTTRRDLGAPRSEDTCRDTTRRDITLREP
jgi:hypothetical protein